MRKLLITYSLFCCAAPVYAALTITAPVSNMVVMPGQTVTVTVDPGGSKYNFVALVGENPIGAAQPTAAQPYSFSITIPAKIPALGKYTLTAVGNLGASQNDDSAPILLDVERPDQPVGLKAEISYLETSVAEKTNMTVTATYSDGSNFDVTQATATTYLSSNPSVATVSADGIVTAVAPGACKVIIDGMLIIPVVVRAPMQILPLFAAAYPSWTRQFAAPVANPANNTSVRWSVTPAGAGSVDGNGVYHAPQSVAASEFVTVTATSVADSTVSASATVLVSPPIVVAVSPASATLAPSQIQVFQAQLTNDMNDAGDANSGVLWSLTGPGTVLENTPSYFVYQAPAAAPTSAAAQKVTVKAMSITDSSKTATAAITLSH